MCVCLRLGLQQTGADRDSPSRVLRGRAEPAATETVGSDCLPTSGLNFAPSPSRVGGFVPGPSSVRCVPDRGHDGLGTAPIGTRDGVLDDTDVAAVASTGVSEAMSTVEAVVAVAVEAKHASRATEVQASTDTPLSTGKFGCLCIDNHG